MDEQKTEFSWFLLTCLMISFVFAGLGFWQINRAQEKEQLQQRIDQRALLPPRDELPMITEDASLFEFMPIALRGNYVTDHTILIDNVVYQGQAGYQVYSAFQLEGEKVSIMVDRGWIPAPGNRSNIPEVSVPQGIRSEVGTLHLPLSRPVMLSNDVSPDIEGNQRWVYLDLEYLAKKTRWQVYPMVLRLDKASKALYKANWPRFDAKRGMHIGYAIQWFVFSVVLFCTVVVVYRRRMIQNQASKER